MSRTSVIPSDERLDQALINDITSWISSVVNNSKNTRTLNEQEYDWHTCSLRRCPDIPGFILEVEGSMSSMGGYSFRIFDSRGTAEKLLFRSHSQLDNARLEKEDDFAEWYAWLQSPIAAWRKERDEDVARRKQEATEIHRHRPEATDAVEARLAVIGMLLLPISASDNQCREPLRKLAKEQEIGLISPEETWTGQLLIITLSNRKEILVTSQHPDFEALLSLTIGAVPNFFLADEPTPPILPPFARYLRLR